MRLPTPTNKSIDCIICGTTVTAKTSRRVYCSTVCGDAGRRQGVVVDQDHRKSATCVGCGEEFTRPASYPSKMKYCSNECSHREVKRVRDRFVMELHEDAIVFRSTYEMRFVSSCMRFDLPWRRYDLGPIDGPFHVSGDQTYTPDFVVSVNGEEWVVEVKGRISDDDAEKIEVASRVLDRYLVVTQPVLERFEERDMSMFETRGLGKVVKPA